MNPIIKTFEDAAKKQGIAIEKSEDTRKVKTYEGKEVDLKQVLYRTTLQLGEHGLVPASILFQDDDKRKCINYQISYSSVAQITDRNQLPEVLEQLNQMNVSKTGYYHFTVHPDGSIGLRNVGLTTEDITAVLDIFVFAGRLIGMLLNDLKNIKGIKVLPAKPRK